MIGSFARDAATAPFLDGAAAGQFLLRHCQNAHFSEPAAQSCTTCGSPDLEWNAAAGKARLVSWAITAGRAEAGAEPVRSVLVIAEFEEGPWWWSCLLDADPDQLTEGAALTVGFEPAGEEQLPVFRLA